MMLDEIAKLRDTAKKRGRHEFELHTMHTLRGVDVAGLIFPTQAELMNFFITHCIGNPKMQGHASKAIGNTLLIWER